MIDMLLRKLSTEHYVYYIEKRTYKNNKVYKSYVINIDRIKKEYNNKCDLLYGLKEMIQLAGTKLTDKQRKKIIADYIKNTNKCETARMNDVSETTVRKIIKEENINNSITRKLEEKSKQNTMDTISYMHGPTLRSLRQ